MYPPKSNGTQDPSFLVNTFNSVLRELLDKHAPEVERKITLRLHAPWFNDSLHESKKKKNPQASP